MKCARLRTGFTRFSALRAVGSQHLSLEMPDININSVRNILKALEENWFKSDNEVANKCAHLLKSALRYKQAPNLLSVRFKNLGFSQVGILSWGNLRTPNCYIDVSVDLLNGLLAGKALFYLFSEEIEVPHHSKCTPPSGLCMEAKDREDQ